MSKINFATLMKKYDDTIKEEINIKELWEIDKSINIKKTYKPLWSKLSSKFGKDTWRIIQLGKDWMMKDIDNERIMIYDGTGNERILEKDDFEVSYEWLEWENMAVDGNIIAKLDLEIDEKLQKEWVAREMSRFINQMRKEADYNVDDKILLKVFSDDKYLNSVLDDFWEFLCQEALLSGIKKENKKSEWDIVANFVYDENIAIFCLKR